MMLVEFKSDYFRLVMLVLVIELYVSLI